MVRTISDMCSDSVRLRDEQRYHKSMFESVSAEIKLIEYEILKWTEDD